MQFSGLSDQECVEKGLFLFLSSFLELRTLNVPLLNKYNRRLFCGSFLLGIYSNSGNAFIERSS